MPNLPDEQLRKIVEDAGAEWVGIQENIHGREALVLFHDPTTHGQCTLYRSAVTSDNVRLSIKAKREEILGVPQ